MKSIRKVIRFLFVVLLVNSFVITKLNAQKKSNDAEIQKSRVLADSSFFLYNTNPKKGVKVGKEALALSQQINDANGQARALNSIGVNYWVLHDWDNAIDVYLKASRIFDSLNNETSLSAVTNNLGNLFAQMKNPDKAMEYHQKSLKVRLRLKDTLGIGESYFNLGSIYTSKNEFDSAIIYTNKALEIFQLIQYRKGLFTSYESLSKNYEKKRQYSSAIRYGEKALEFINVEASHLDRTTFYNMMAKLYMQLDWYERAFTYLKKNQEIFDKHDFVQQKIDHLFLYSQYLEAKGNIKEALAYSREHFVLFDSVYKKDQTNRLIELNAKYESEKQKKENEKLKTSLLEQELIVERGKNLSYLLYAGIFMALVSALFIFLRFRSERKHNKLLKAKNDIIHKQNNELKSLNSTKDRFFSIVAHDLKNPFTAILGYLDILKMENKQESQNTEEYVEIISQAAEHTYTYLENLLQWAQTQTGSVKLVKEKCEINGLVDSAVAPHLLSAQKKSIQVSTKSLSTEILYIDKRSMQIVIGNLFSNAIKFTNPDGHIDFTVFENDSETRLSISDSGVGMSEKQLAKLFKIEENVSTQGTNKEMGTGLGLIICHELMQQNNARIEVESELGKGSTFHLIFNK